MSRTERFLKGLMACALVTTGLAGVTAVTHQPLIDPNPMHLVASGLHNPFATAPAGAQLLVHLPK